MKDDDGRRWKRADLTGAGIRNGETGKVWRGIDITAKGRHWGNPPSVLDDLDQKGRIHWPQKEGGMPRLKQYPEDLPGVPVSDVITDIRVMHNLSEERLGYPTQKPVALLERIVSASSNEGDVVLDPFCGCGTTVHAAQKLGRQWIGIDVTHLAIGLIEKRLRDAFPNVQFSTHGVPRDIEAARDLANRGAANPRYYYEFEKWAVALLSGQPTKRTGDGGIDGNIYFGKTGRAIIEVKSGKVGSPQVARLRGALERHKADIAVFLTLDPPNKGMLAEAASAGQYAMEGFEPVPRVQIVTVEDALKLRDRAVRLPARRDDTFKRAAREEDRGAQGSLDL